jgi:GT2 family glycosyltransferase
MASVSIIVINWNGEEYLADCLEALLTQVTPDDEIIVVDNDSTDSSVELVHSCFPGIKLLCNERNLGYAGGANTGLRSGRGDVLILLNPDVKVLSGWLVALKDVLKKNERIGIAGCKLLFPDGKMIQHAGGKIDFPSALPVHYGFRQCDSGQWDQIREVDYVTGAAFAVHRRTLDKVGFFDEHFYPGYYEEVDFCFRTREAGYQVLYVPQAVAIHYEHATLEEVSFHFYYFFHRNRLRFLFKYLTPDEFVIQFAPKEREWLAGGLSINERCALARAYLGGVMVYPNLYSENKDGTESRRPDPDQIHAVVEVLSDLRRQVWTVRL